MIFKKLTFYFLLFFLASLIVVNPAYSSSEFYRSRIYSDGKSDYTLKFTSVDNYSLLFNKTLMSKDNDRVSLLIANFQLKPNKGSQLFKEGEKVNVFFKHDNQVLEKIEMESVYRGLSKVFSKKDRQFKKIIAAMKRFPEIIVYDDQSKFSYNFSLDQSELVIGEFEKVLRDVPDHQIAEITTKIDSDKPEYEDFCELVVDYAVRAYGLKKAGLDSEQFIKNVHDEMVKNNAGEDYSFLLVSRISYSVKHHFTDNLSSTVSSIKSYNHCINQLLNVSD